MKHRDQPTLTGDDRLAPAPQSADEWVQAFWISLFGAAVSLVHSSWLFGFNVNFFHLPIVSGLHELPQFADDAFIQSLKAFSSGIWMLLEGSAKVVPAEPLFLGLLFASRALTMLGFVLICRDFGCRSPWQQLGVVAFAAVTPLMRGPSYAGDGGLFMLNFSHSEVANGLTLLMLHAMQNRRFGTALALNGAVFFANAFMAVWNVAALLAMALAVTDKRALFAWRSWAGLAVAIALAAPVLQRTLQTNMLQDDGPSFEYRDFLSDYYPFHFLAEANPLRLWLGVACVLAIAWAGLLRIGPTARPLALACAGYMAVYAVGIVLPELTDSRVLLNLHLLRVSVEFHLIATAVLVVCVQKAWRSERAVERWFEAPLLLAGGGVHKFLLPLVPLVLLARLLPPVLRARLRTAAGAARRALGSPPLRATGVAMLATSAIGVGAMTWNQHASVGRIDAAYDEWRALAMQVAERTDPHAVFLIPADAQYDAGDTVGSNAFLFYARRQSWTNYRSGAAVMWSPGYYPQWRERNTEVQQLAGWPDWLRYARAKGIDFVVADCEGAPDQQPLIRTRNYCVVQVDG